MMNLLAFKTRCQDITHEFGFFCQQNKLIMSRVRLLVLLLHFLTFEIFQPIYLLLFSSVQLVIIIFACGTSLAVVDREDM